MNRQLSSSTNLIQQSDNVPSQTQSPAVIGCPSPIRTGPQKDPLTNLPLLSLEPEFAFESSVFIVPRGRFFDESDGPIEPIEQENVPSPLPSPLLVPHYPHPQLAQLPSHFYLAPRPPHLTPVPSTLDTPFIAPIPVDNQQDDEDDLDDYDWFNQGWTYYSDGRVVGPNGEDEDYDEDYDDDDENNSEYNDLYDNHIASLQQEYENAPPDLEGHHNSLEDVTTELLNNNEPQVCGEFECSICLGKTPLGDAIFTTRCKHMFCIACIATWAHTQLQASTECKCPLCRQVFLSM